MLYLMLCRSEPQGIWEGENHHNVAHLIDTLDRLRKSLCGALIPIWLWLGRLLAQREVISSHMRPLILLSVLEDQSGCVCLIK